LHKDFVGTWPDEILEERPMTDRAPPVIAIDGPSASGKGTVAQAVAAALGFHYLNSGALYRLVALLAGERGASLDDEAALATLARDMQAGFRGATILLEGRDVSGEIQAETVGAAASRVAASPRVRAALLDRQRAFRRPPGLVADGRDMGGAQGISDGEPGRAGGQAP
jgi:cytidylate kinase